MPRGQPPVTQLDLLAMMRAHDPVPMTKRELEIACGLGKDAVSGAMAKLVVRQLVHVVGSRPNRRGISSPVYSLTPPPPPVDPTAALAAFFANRKP